MYFYKGIATANSAFPIIAKMKADNVLDQSLADRLTGEAYFLRGLFYYYLASTFGGVPLELKTLEATDAGLHPGTPRMKYLPSVESDMTTAARLVALEGRPAGEEGQGYKRCGIGLPRAPLKCG